ncbi:unnamed protein product [Lactuca saligna]|uniref:MULE transposase domain-containing protein n=1 Tax=Lactuca saligna TaxID=75948 RepID=A0AA35V6I8_LACSI|nr:unnamed protein product [Lactuca saligna]
MLAPNPLVYLDPMRMSVRDVDFGGMDYREFVLWVSKLTRRIYDNLYYYIIECDHEPDKEVHTFDKTFDDEFLNKLCGKPILNSNQEEVNDDEVNDEDDGVVFTIFDENQEWDKIVPFLARKFSNPLELKLCLSNYAVKNGDQLLPTIERDANNHIYLVAWVVAVVENKETWKWFLDLLIDDIGMGVGHGLTIISDQHKGFVEDVKERVPAAEHKQCASTSMLIYKKDLRLEPLAYEHLMERDSKTWCKACYQVDRSCDAYENGVSESFKLKLNKLKEQQRFLQVVPFGYMQFDVRVGLMDML